MMSNQLHFVFPHRGVPGCNIKPLCIHAKCYPLTPFAFTCMMGEALASDEPRGRVGLYNCPGQVCFAQRELCFLLQHAHSKHSLQACCILARGIGIPSDWPNHRTAPKSQDKNPKICALALACVCLPSQYISRFISLGPNLPRKKPPDV
jgi:hypothetical protein